MKIPYKNRYISLFTIFFLYIFFSNCGGGLNPTEETFLNGVIKFRGGQEAWPRPYINPEEDSVYDIRFVAFKNFPPADIVLEVLSGEALLSESLPRFVDSSEFSIEIHELPLELKYLAVAQQYDSSIFTDWRVIGVYTLSGDKKEHSSIVIDKKQIYNINIEVDFDNLPPQHF